MDRFQVNGLLIRLVAYKVCNIGIYGIDIIIAELESVCWAEVLGRRHSDAFGEGIYYASRLEVALHKALSYGFSVANQVHIKGFIAKVCMELTKVPAESVIRFNVLIGIVESSLAKFLGLSGW